MAGVARLRATCTCRVRSSEGSVPVTLRNSAGLSVLEAFGDHPQGEGLDLRNTRPVRTCPALTPPPDIAPPARPDRGPASRSRAACSRRATARPAANCALSSMTPCASAAGSGSCAAGSSTPCDALSLRHRGVGRHLPTTRVDSSSSRAPGTRCARRRSGWSSRRGRARPGPGNARCCRWESPASVGRLAPGGS
jgi:hypothetical protein